MNVCMKASEEYYIPTLWEDYLRIDGGRVVKISNLKHLHVDFFFRDRDRLG